MPPLYPVLSAQRGILRAMIILLNGSINSGKTTVAKQLIQLLPRTAHVEVDDLREFIRFLPLAEAIPLNPALAVALTNRGTRELSDWERGKISRQYEDGRNSPPFGIVIDNTRQAPDETARQILDRVKE